MPENYTVNSDVVLSADVKLKVKKIADAYFKATQKTIVVTSGTRSSSSQAEAMYGKLAGGDQLAVYRDQKSVKEIKKAYEDAKKAKKGKPEIIKAMQSVIDGQIKKGVYISRHLRGCHRRPLQRHVRYRKGSLQEGCLGCRQGGDSGDHSTALAFGALIGRGGRRVARFPPPATGQARLGSHRRLEVVP